jgi:hypothetical protein
MKREIAFEIVDYLKKTRNIIPDELALKYIALYPNWESGKQLTVGDRIKHNGKLYVTLKEHITKENLTPDIAADLFKII